MSGTNQESFEKLKTKIIFVIMLAMGVIMVGHYMGYFFTGHKSDDVLLAELQVQQAQMGGYIDADGEKTPEFERGKSQGFEEGYMQGYDEAMMMFYEQQENAETPQ